MDLTKAHYRSYMITSLKCADIKAFLPRKVALGGHSFTYLVIVQRDTKNVYTL